MLDLGDGGGGVGASGEEQLSLRIRDSTLTWLNAESEIDLVGCSVYVGEK